MSLAVRRSLLNALASLSIFLLPYGLVYGAAARSPSEPVTLTTLISAWQSRQQRVRTARFTWLQNISGRNAWSSDRAAWVRSEPRAEPGAPASTLTFGESAFRYETQRWYHRGDLEMAGLNLSSAVSDSFCKLHIRLPPEESLKRALYYGTTDELIQTPRMFVSTFDGRTRRDLFASGEGEWGEGAVSAGPGYQGISGVVDGLDFWPLVLTYRPIAEAGAGIEPQNCRLLPGAVMVRGRTCLRVVETKPDHHVNEYFVDPERDCTIVRALFRAGKAGRTRQSQMDIDYEPDPVAGWRPVSWTGIVYRDWRLPPQFPGDDHLPRFSASELTSADWNLEVSADLLQIAFPPRTLVADSKSRRTYLILADGSEQVLTAADGRAGWGAVTTDADRERSMTATLRALAARWWMYLIPLAAFSLAGVFKGISVLRRRRTPFPPDSPGISRE